MLITVGCAGESKDQAVENESRSKDAVTEQKPNTTALNSVGDLPVCSMGNDSQLVYIKDDSLFYECRNSAWEAIIINSENKLITSSSEGTDGLDASEFWEDKKTGKTWYKAGQRYGSYGGRCLYASDDPDAYILDGAFREPTVAEAQEALRNGIYDEMRIRVIVNMKNGYYAFSDDPDTVHVKGVEGWAGFVICIKN